MIRYPKLITSAKEKLSCVEKDMRDADAAILAEPDFAVTIGNARYMERVDGGASLLEAFSRCKAGEITHIGSFKGFRILAEKNHIGIHHIILRGKTDYKAELSHSPVGNMIKLENILGGMEQAMKGWKQRIEQYERDMEQSKLEYEKPFAEDEELKEKTARLNELNVQLDLGNANMGEMEMKLNEKAVPENSKLADVASSYGEKESGRIVG